MRQRGWYNPANFRLGVNQKVQKPFQLLIILSSIYWLLVGCAPQSDPNFIATSTSAPEIEPTLSIVTQTLNPEPTEAQSPTLTLIPTVTLIPTETQPPQTVIAFTGVIVPARCVQAEIDERGNADYLYDDVRDILTSADITVGVYNATMTDQVNYVGCENSWELVGSPNNADALSRAGFDVMSVATNHIKDCGKQSCGDVAFFDTLHHLERVGIQTVGAGENLMEAKQPIVVEVNGIRFGFVSLGDVNQRVFSDAVTPGIAVLTKGNLISAIEAAQKISDVVIVLPHSGPEDFPEVTPQQRYWARHSVEAGANLVVITHAHILQGYQILEDVPVFYSLGNFVFDQIWSRDHQQGAILLVTFAGEEIIQFEFIPTVVDQDGTVHLAVGEEEQEIRQRIESLSKDLEISD